MNRSLALLALMGACSTAMAADWVLVGTQDTMSVYIDVDSVARNGSRFKCWVKTEFSEIWKMKSNWVTHTIAREVVDIQRKNFAVMQVHFYSERDAATPFHSSRLEPEETVNFHEPLPGSMGEKLVSFVEKKFGK